MKNTSKISEKGRKSPNILRCHIDSLKTCSHKSNVKIYGRILGNGDTEQDIFLFIIWKNATIYDIWCPYMSVVFICKLQAHNNSSFPRSFLPFFNTIVSIFVGKVFSSVIFCLALYGWITCWDFQWIMWAHILVNLYKSLSNEMSDNFKPIKYI